MGFLRLLLAALLAFGPGNLFLGPSDANARPKPWHKRKRKAKPKPKKKQKSKKRQKFKKKSPRKNRASQARVGSHSRNGYGRFRRAKFSTSDISKIIKGSQALSKASSKLSVGQRSLQKKLDRQGNKFGKYDGRGPPSQARVERHIREILTSPNAVIKEVKSSALPEGGFKVRSNGVGSPGLLLDRRLGFVGFAN